MWEIVCRAGWVGPHLLPAPSAVFLRLAELLQQPAFLNHAAQTLIRLFAGLGLATTSGIAIGLFAARSELGGRLLEPLVRILAPIPKIALYPAVILILGFDHASKITLVVVDAIFPVLLATYHGARMVEPKLIWSARAAGTSEAACTLKIVLPAALPSIVTGFRIALAVSCVVVFLAEMISSSDGLGHLLILAARSFRTLDMFVPLIAISLIGLILNGLATLAGRRLLAGFPEPP
ncbi:MAG: ABC transporter permease [Sulfuritalea sp.]|nr:ABC transporter permease [Sulfuritalea sp.]